MASNFDISVILSLVDNMSAGMKAASKTIGEVGKSMEKVGRKMTAFVTVPIALATRQILGSFKEIETSMIGLKMASGANGEQLQTLKKAADQFGMSSARGANEAAQAMIVLSKAGLSQTKVMETMNAVQTLAVGTNTSMAESAQAISDIMNGYKLSASDTGHVLDVLASMQFRAKGSIQEFSKVLREVGPRARAIGVDIDQLAGVMGVLTDNMGLGATEAGKVIKKVFKTLSSQQIREIVNRGDITKYRKELIKAGIAQSAFDEMTKTLDFQLGQLKASWQELGRALVEAGFVDMLKSLIGYIQKIIHWFKGLDSETKETIVMLLGIAAAMGPVLMYAGLMATALAALNPYVLAITAALVGFGSAIKTIRDNWDFIKSLSLSDIFGGFREMIKDNPALFSAIPVTAPLVAGQRGGEYIVRLVTGPGVDARVEKITGDKSLNVISESDRGQTIAGGVR